jgi:HEAT repeat protein
MPSLAASSDLLTSEIEELLVSDLAVDTSAAIRARAAEVVVYLSDHLAPPVLRELLHDKQWFVRLRTVQALDDWRKAVASLHLDLRECLSDPHWQVREAAIRTLISLGQPGKRQLYEYFLTSQDRTTCAQIVEVIERTGLMAALVEQYSAGTQGVDALMVEQLAGEAAPLGLSGILRTLNSDTRQKFLDRFLPHAEAKLRFLGDKQFAVEGSFSPQQALDFPLLLTA